MAHTSNLQVLTKHLQKKFEDAKVDLGVQDVFYGDQNRIPRTPAICVEAGEKERELNGAPRRTLVDVTLYVLIYHGAIQSVQLNLEEVDSLAEEVESLIHQDPQFIDPNDASGFPAQVIHSLVTRVEAGYQMRSNTIFRATRLTVVARVQEQLPLQQEV